MPPGTAGDHLISVAYQGAPGSFSEQAALRHSGPGVTTMPCRTFAEVADAIMAGRASHGMLPVENTLAGTIPDVWHILATRPLAVVGERIEPIHHALLGLPDASPDDLRQVLSHPVALAQCSAFFRARPALEAVAWYDTAGAAGEVASRRDRRIGAIASAQSAARYGLDVLAHGLEDRGDNQTRFYVVTGPFRGASLPQGPARVTLLVEAANRPGALLGLLKPLAEHSVNLSLLVSQPTGVPWTYRFIMECEVEGASGESAFAEVARRSLTCRRLGPFTRARSADPAHDAP